MKNRLRSHLYLLAACIALSSAASEQLFADPEAGAVQNRPLVAEETAQLPSPITDAPAATSSDVSTISDKKNPDSLIRPPLFLSPKENAAFSEESSETAPAVHSIDSATTLVSPVSQTMAQPPRESTVVSVPNSLKDSSVSSADADSEPLGEVQLLLSSASLEPQISTATGTASHGLKHGYHISPTPGEAEAQLLIDIAGTKDVELDTAGLPMQVNVDTPLHLDEAVAFALKNNFEALASDQKMRSVYWDKMGAYSELLPSVRVGKDGGWERSQPASINDSQGNRVLDNSHYRRDKYLTVSQPLVDLGLIADIMSGKDKEALAENDHTDTREGVAFETISTYFTLLEARLSIRLADDYKVYLDKLAERMNSRVQGGGATQADLERIHGRAATAEAARIEALGAYQTQLAAMRRLTRITPSYLSIPAVLMPTVPDTVDEATQRALASNPSYLSSLKKIDVAKDDRDKSFAGAFPKLSVEYNNSYTHNAGAAAEGSPIDGVYPNQKTQQILLVAQFALSGGTAITGGLSGMAKVNEMELHALDAKSRIEEGVISSYFAINAARQRQEIITANVTANQKVVEGFEIQFVNGTRSMFELLDAYEQLYNARLNLVRVTIAGAKAAYQIRRMMGELVPSIMGSEKRG